MRTTRPLVMPGAGVLVEDLVLTFEAAGSSTRPRRAASTPCAPQLDSDEGARSLGEVSLVEGSLAGAGRRRHLPRHAVRREHRLPRRLGPGLPVLRPRRARDAAPTSCAALGLNFSRVAHRRRHRRSGGRRRRAARRRDRRTPGPGGRLGGPRHRLTWHDPGSGEPGPCGVVRCRWVSGQQALTASTVKPWAVTPASLVSCTEPGRGRDAGDRRTPGPSCSRCRSPACCRRRP